MAVLFFMGGAVPDEGALLGIHPLRFLQSTNVSLRASSPLCHLNEIGTFGYACPESVRFGKNYRPCKAASRLIVLRVSAAC